MIQKRIFVLMLISLALIMPIAFAASETGDLHSGVFDARYTEASCRIDRFSAILNAYETCTSQSFSNANSSLTKLNTDMSQIKTAADAGNRTQLIDLMKVYARDTKSLMDALRTAKSSFHDRDLTEKEKNSTKSRNLTTASTVKVCIKDIFDKATADFASCHNNAVINQGKAVAAWLGAWKDKWNNIISNMSAKGYDTTGMTGVVSGVDGAITQINDAVSSGNATHVIDAEKTVKDEQLHLWANFNIARLEAYITNLTSLAQSNETGTLNDAQNYLNDAKTMTAPGTPYGPGQFDKTWDDIKAAAIDISAVIKAIHASK
jgi:hypothetical protein